MRFDVFISHASEDKNEFVRPFALALKSLGVRVWYDEFSLKAGDSLRRSIDSGLKNSRYGVVVLSPNFFAKGWPEWELNGLVQRHIVEDKGIIIPVWHNISSREVARYSPAIADIVAIKSSVGSDNVANEVYRIIQTNESIDEAEIGPTDTGRSRRLIYIGTIKGMVGDAGDEIRLHVRLPETEDYVFYNDGCGLYGYSCWVPFERVFSNRIFAVCHFKRISEMPLSNRLYGGPRLITNDKLLTWEDVKTTRVDNIHFDMFATSDGVYNLVIRHFQKMMASDIILKSASS